MLATLTQNCNTLGLFALFALSLPEERKDSKGEKNLWSIPVVSPTFFPENFSTMCSNIKELLICKPVKIQASMQESRGKGGGMFWYHKIRVLNSYNKEAGMEIWD